MIGTCQELATQPCLQEQQVDERNSFYWGGGVLHGTTTGRGCLPTKHEEGGMGGLRRGWAVGLEEKKVHSRHRNPSVLLHTVLEPLAQPWPGYNRGIIFLDLRGFI